MPRATVRASVARRLAAYSTDLEAGAGDADVRVPDQLGAGSGRHAVWALRATVHFTVDFQKVIRAPAVVLDVERTHVKLEWHILLDDAVLVVGVLPHSSTPRPNPRPHPLQVGVHALVGSDRARSGDNLEG